MIYRFEKSRKYPPLDRMAIGWRSCLADSDRRRILETTLTAMRRLFRVEFTTAHAGARTTSQTTNISWLRWMEGAHPYMLLYLLGGNRVALTWRVARNGLSNPVRWRGTPVHRRCVAVRGRRTTSSRCWTIRIAWRLTCATWVGAVHSWRATGSWSVRDILQP